ncbi:MAG: hypothetical protein AAFR03_03600 [Pseudomonadota bacterium]
MTIRHFSLILISVLAQISVAGAQVAGAQGATGYEPMKPFEPFAGKTFRGEGKGPDGRAIVDLSRWQFILGGRALETEHRLENGSYGGKTIFFYDENGKEYVFHYFTTAGFHTTGTMTLTDTGFMSVEKVIGHDVFDEVRADITIDGDTLIVRSSHVTKDGEVSEGEAMVYKPHDIEVDLFGGSKK